MIDVAALTLEDQFPELTSRQVHEVLKTAEGDLNLATQLCRSLLTCDEQDSSALETNNGEFLDSFLDSVVRSCVRQQSSPKHRLWWPSAATSTAANQQAGSEMFVSTNTTVSMPLLSKQEPTRTLRPHTLAPERAHKSTVRVLQRHSTEGQVHHAARQGNSAASSVRFKGFEVPMDSSSNHAASLASAEGLHFAAVFLKEDSRDRVLHCAPPLHEVVSADHMTLAYRPTLEQCQELPLGREVALFVEGVVSDYKTQALAVQHPSWLPFLSDSVPHVTVSVGEGVPAREAGDLVRGAQQGVGPRVVPLVGMKLLHGTVGVKLDDGTIVFSADELREGLERLQHKPPTLDQSAPVRILKRGERPAPQKPPLPQPPSNASPLQQLQVQPSVGRVHSRQRPAADVVFDTAAATPCLEELLDLLHMEDTTGSAPARTAQQPAAPCVKLNPARHRSSMTSPASGGATGTRSSGHGGVDGATSGAAPQLTSTQRPFKAQLAPPLPPPQQQRHYEGAPRRLLERGTSSVCKARDASAAIGAPDETAGLDLLSALAERLGAAAEEGPASTTSRKQQSPQVGSGISAPILPPSSHSLLQPQPPMFSPSLRLQQGPGPRRGPAPAASRTLADFLPSDMAAPDQQLPIPFFLDSNDSPPPVPQQHSHNYQPQQQQVGHPVAGENNGRMSGSVGGYESSSSSMACEAESSAGGGTALTWQHVDTPATVRSAEDLRQVFPGLEAEVLEAALQMHGGDAPEAASFLAALNTQQTPHGAAVSGGVAGAASPSSGQSYPALSSTSQQALPPWAGGRKGAGGRAGSGGRGGNSWKQKGHTGASDPIAVAERQAMSLHFAAKNMYGQAARAAAARGAYTLSRELTANSQHHGEQAAAARRRANSTAYRTSNRSVTNTFKLDLHGLHVDEALQVLERHLVSLGGLGHPGGIVLEVVTGLGRHSSAGQPRLLPAVVRFLSDAGYRFDSQEGNSGLINVFIGC